MKPANISKQQLLDVIQQYPFKQDACKALGVCVTTLNKWLQIHNLIYPRTSWRALNSSLKYRPDLDKNWLQSHWIESDLSLAQLAKQEGVPLGVLEHRASKYNLTKKFKYKFNWTKLMDLNDPHLYYLAGLVATDGHFSKTVDSVEVGLVGDSERCLLQDIATYYEFTGSLWRCKNHSYCLRFSGQGIRDFFSTRLAITAEQKTYSVVGPTIFPSEDCAKAYVRGCWDGDGYISKKGRARMELCTASRALVDNIQYIVESYTGIKMCRREEYRPAQDRYYPNVGIAGENARKILSWMYSLENCFRLERKFLNYYRLMIQSELQ